MINLINVANSVAYQFRKFKVASTLNLAGLCIALATFFLFFTKVEETVKYNTCFKDYQNIYRVEIDGKIFSNDSIHIANVFAPSKDIALRTRHVEDVCLMCIENPNTSSNSKLRGTMNINGKHYITYVHNGYAEYLKMFGVKIIDSVKVRHDGDLLVPKSFANYIFGTTRIAGKTIVWNGNNGKNSARIAAVYEDFPKNCCVKNSFYQYGPNQDVHNFGNYNYHLYVRIDDKSNIPTIEEELFRNYLEDYGMTDIPDDLSVFETKICLQPLHKSYFSNVDEATDQGNVFTLAILFFSALFIVVITNVNFMNFNLAIAPIRIKGINTHRVFGAGRFSLITGIIMESLMLTTLAFCISMLGIFLLDMIIEGDISPLSHIRIFIYTFVVSIIIALISSAYPAYFATSVKPAVALKSMIGISKRSRRLRTIRVAYQIIMCAVAFTCTSTLLLQITYIYTADYGFKRNEILIGSIENNAHLMQNDAIIKRLQKIDGVESVSFSAFMMSTDERYMQWARRTHDNKYSLITTIMPVDWNYLTTLGIKITEGRNFRKGEKDAYIFNEAARRKYPWLSVGKPLLPYDNHENPTIVVGFCSDLIFSSLRKNNYEEPLVFYCTNDPNNRNFYQKNSKLNIRLTDNADEEKVINAIKKEYSNITGTDDNIELQSLNTHLSFLYIQELEFFIQMGIIALIYISITLIGVFCLTMFEGEYRRKEIGIRKVFGATTMEILMMFNKKYLHLTVIGFIISIPCSMYVGQMILEKFLIHSPYLWAAYPIAFIILSLLILGTVSIQSLKNAKEMPANNLNK